MKGEQVGRRFLFRLDGAKDNDDFFRARRSANECVAYSGIAMSVGPGWIPDLVEVSVNDDSPLVTVTLIELEAAEATALVSCRKYLPESSSDIVERFSAYLDTVRRQCQATADPRLGAFDDLAGVLSGHTDFLVRSAGALRTSSEFLELHDLLDQPGRISIPSAPVATTPPAAAFSGARSFSREEIDALRRTVRILHAVMTGHDHSAGTVHSWRNLRRKPLDTAAAAAPERLRELHQLLSHKSASGMRLDCDQVAQELAGLWASTPGRRMTSDQVADVIRRFAPRSMMFSNRESMAAVYDAARSTVDEVAI